MWCIQRWQLAHRSIHFCASSFMLLRLFLFIKFELIVKLLSVLFLWWKSNNDENEPSKGVPHSSHLPPKDSIRSILTDSALRVLYLRLHLFLLSDAALLRCSALWYFLMLWPTRKRRYLPRESSGVKFSPHPQAHSMIFSLDIFKSPYTAFCIAKHAYELIAVYQQMSTRKPAKKQKTCQK